MAIIIKWSTNARTSRKNILIIGTKEINQGPTIINYKYYFMKH